MFNIEQSVEECDATKPHRYSVVGPKKFLLCNYIYCSSHSTYHYFYYTQL